MAHVITITYTAIAAPVVNAVSPICRMFFPEDCAADNSAVSGTYYDTNVAGWGEGTSLEAFMQKVDAHPGLVAAIRKAIRDGEYTMNDADEKTMLLLDEVKGSLADQGIVIVIDPETEAETEAGE